MSWKHFFQIFYQFRRNGPEAVSGPRNGPEAVSGPRNGLEAVSGPKNGPRTKHGRGHDNYTSGKG